jgi:hypothetical protein
MAFSVTSIFSFCLCYVDKSLRPDRSILFPQIVAWTTCRARPIERAVQTPESNKMLAGADGTGHHRVPASPAQGLGRPAYAAASPCRRHAAAAFSGLVVPGTG